MAAVVTPPRALHPAWRGANARLILAAPVEVGPQAAGLGTAAVGLLASGTAKKIVAVNGGVCSLGLGGQLNSVRKVAQIGRAGLGLVGRSTETGQTVPGSYTHITITRDYDLATGQAPTGIVYFTASMWLKNNGVTLVPAPVGAALNSLGQISIALAANTDPGTVPAGSWYVVREEIIGQPTRSYKVAIPYNAGPTIDLATLPVIP